jgi:RNA polymerase sigma factor (sigma-70 family)
MSPVSVAQLSLRPAPARAEALPSPTRDSRALSDWSDLDLTRAVRAGDMEAAGALYARHHPFAVRAARAIGNPGIAEDLASDALTRVVTALLNGRGPDTAVRAYLATTIRNLFADRLRKLNGEVLADPHWTTLDSAEADPTDQALERSVVIEVLAELPERWREVLWRTIVLEQPLAVVGACMGLNANATAALSYRARSALTKAYFSAVSGEAA